MRLRRQLQEVSAFVSVGAAVVAVEPDPHAVKEAAITVAIAIDNTLFHNQCPPLIYNKLLLYLILLREKK